MYRPSDVLLSVEYRPTSRPTVRRDSIGSMSPVYRWTVGRLTVRFWSTIATAFTHCYKVPDVSWHALDTMLVTHWFRLITSWSVSKSRALFETCPTLHRRSVDTRPPPDRCIDRHVDRHFDQGIGRYVGQVSVICQRSVGKVLAHYRPIDCNDRVSPACRSILGRLSNEYQPT